jgi:hypothetical protein
LVESTNPWDFVPRADGRAVKQKTIETKQNKMNDPLNIQIDGRGVDTSTPVLPQGDYPLQIVESVIQSNKAQTGLNWHLKLVTTQEYQSADGKTIKPNFPVFMDIALQPAENSTDAEAFKRQIFAAQDAIVGSDASNRPVFNNEFVQGATGKTVIGSLAVDEYPKGSGTFNNKVRRLKKATA